LRARVDRWLAARGEAARRRLDPKFQHAIYLEHPPTADPAPRFGHGRPAQVRIERWLAARRPEYADLVARLSRYGDEVAAIPVAADPSALEPGLVQEWLPGGDILALYGLVREIGPARYVEVGSGTSTKVVARARQEGDLATHITSIDPAPRAEVDALCDRVVRAPLESVDLALFDDLGAGDMVLMDGSHVAFMGSDVVAFTFDVLPRLAPGVLVGIHDMFWPSDYPPEWGTYWFNEQYVVGGLLLGEPTWLEPVLPVHYVTGDPALSAPLARVWDRPGLEDVERRGSTLWLRTLAPLREG
jgi:hypothetical protein